MPLDDQVVDRMYRLLYTTASSAAGMSLEEPSDGLCYSGESGTPVQTKLAALDNASNKEFVDSRINDELPNGVCGA